MREQPLPLRTLSPTNSTAADCLCLFDVDRTLTGKPDRGRPCNITRRRGVRDCAYGCTDLHTSALSEHLADTFCGRECFVGILSAGDVSGPSSDERTLLWSMLRALPHGSALPGDAASAWGEASRAAAGRRHARPLLTSAWDRHKQRFVPSILDWYREHTGVRVAPGRVFFFDDREDNVAAFAGSEYNALQVSCGSRHTLRNGEDLGLCGGAPSELEAASYGVRVCRDLGRCLHGSPRELGPCLGAAPRTTSVAAALLAGGTALMLCAALLGALLGARHLRARNAYGGDMPRSVQCWDGFLPAMRMGLGGSFS